MEEYVSNKFLLRQVVIWQSKKYKYRAQCYKNFMAIIYNFFDTGKIFQPRLMFTNKAIVCPSEALFRYSTLG
jgi:hypothetical protein